MGGLKHNGRGDYERRGDVSSEETSMGGLKLEKDIALEIDGQRLIGGNFDG